MDKGPSADLVPTVDYAALRLHCAGRVGALVDAICSIPDDLAPVARAATQAIREQIYYGWELPLARARGDILIEGKYESSQWWTDGAAELVIGGRLAPRTRQLVREHVVPATTVVKALLERPRKASETADYLDATLVTCTVLASEDRLLRGTDGWLRYVRAGLSVRKGLHGESGDPPVLSELGLL